MYRTETRPVRLARIRSELERLNVCMEALPSGAVRLTKGACNLLVTSLADVNDDDLVTFAGGRVDRVKLRPAFYGAL